MFQIELAGYVIRVHNHYSYIEKLCKDYLVTDTCDWMLEIKIPISAIQEEQKKSENKSSLPYCESNCVYRQISLELLKYHTMLMHSAVISCDGRGYAFCAKSGTGKSTHIALWKKVLGEHVTIVNGDKPLIRQTSEFTAYGTPWCGKEGWGSRTSVSLNAICFIVRGTQNSIRKMDESEIIQKLFHQLLIPETEELLTAEMDMVDSLIQQIPFYELTCNISEEAVWTAYQALNAGR